MIILTIKNCHAPENGKNMEFYTAIWTITAVKVRTGRGDREVLKKSLHLSHEGGVFSKT